MVENESSQIEEAPQFVIETEKIEEKKRRSPSKRNLKRRKIQRNQVLGSYVKPLLFAFLLITCLAIGAGIGYYFFQHNLKKCQ